MRPLPSEHRRQKEIGRNGGMKLIVMAFDGREKLSLHRAPGDAMLVSLEGEANIVYEGTAHIMKAGDMIYFEKGAFILWKRGKNENGPSAYGEITL